MIQRFSLRSGSPPVADRGHVESPEGSFKNGYVQAFHLSVQQQLPWNTTLEIAYMGIWHGITRDDLLQYSPALADRLAMISATESYDDIVKSLLTILRRPQKELQTSAASLGNGSPGKKGEMISAANYDGPNGSRVNLFVRKSLNGEGVYVLEEADGSEQEGPLQDIALKYVTADRKLTMNGHKRMGFRGSGQYPQFNL